MSVEDFGDAVERYHQALREFVKGNPMPNHQIFSHRDDVTLLNPLNPVARGWEQVAATMEHASAQLRDGEITAFERIAEYIASDFVAIVEIERNFGRAGAREDIAPLPLRVTTIFRREDDGWKVAHRHADPITTPRTIESIVQE